MLVNKKENSVLIDAVDELGDIDALLSLLQDMHLKEASHHAGTHKGVAQAGHYLVLTDIADRCRRVEELVGSMLHPAQKEPGLQLVPLETGVTASN